MNILFVTENEISQQLGETDRITITLSDDEKSWMHLGMAVTLYNYNYWSKK